jgi:hypothetical protein
LTTAWLHVVIGGHTMEEGKGGKEIVGSDPSAYMGMRHNGSGGFFVNIFLMLL